MAHPMKKTAATNPIYVDVNISFENDYNLDSSS